MVLAVVAADDLGFMDRTDQDRSRPATLLPGWPSVRRKGENKDTGHKDKDAHFAESLAARWETAVPLSNQSLKPTTPFGSVRLRESCRRGNCECDDCEQDFHGMREHLTRSRRKLLTEANVFSSNSGTS